MKKFAAFVLAGVLSLTGCADKKASIVNVIEGNLQTYHEMSDGTWELYDGHIYKHRLEISGTMPNAEETSTFVYLSNIENITFEQAMMGSGLSSADKEYFSVEDAVLVEVK